MTRKLSALLSFKCDCVNYYSLVIIKLYFLLQSLKKEVSFARIKLMEPIIKGSGGLEYLQKAFTDRFGSPNGASNTIPLTRQWLHSTSNSSTEEWTEHIDFCTALSASHVSSILIKWLST